MALFLLAESASGFLLAEKTSGTEIGDTLPEIQDAVQDASRFCKAVKMRAFMPFADEKVALQSINAISEGVLDETLRNFLEMNMPSGSKAAKCQLGVAEDKLGSAIQEALRVKCTKGSTVLELLRGVRLHFTRYVNELDGGALEKAQLGLAHAYGRGKIKFNVNRIDTMIVQSIALLDQLDKDINTFAMRVREWYSYHFPELAKLANDNIQYARLAQHIKRKDSVTEAALPALAAACGGDEDKAAEIYEAAKHSMGTEISALDVFNIERFATRVVDLAEYRAKLHNYLRDRMNAVAPNLSALVGELVGARLIAHAGSLTALAKYPASTVQILGAEKALFRALKTKGATPKYGLIFASSFIGRASTANKGRISRHLANKCSIAARMDAFSDSPTSSYGEALKAQVEERLSFYETGKAPRRNIDVMRETIKKLQEAATECGMAVDDSNALGKRRSPAAIADEMDVDNSDSDSEEERHAHKKSKKEKKKSSGSSKKDKSSSGSSKKDKSSSGSGKKEKKSKKSSK